jgi:hypothetical protein
VSNNHEPIENRRNELQKLAAKTPLFELVRIHKSKCGKPETFYAMQITEEKVQQMVSEILDCEFPIPAGPP